MFKIIPKIFFVVLSVIFIPLFAQESNAFQVKFITCDIACKVSNAKALNSIKIKNSTLTTTHIANGDLISLLDHPIQITVPNDEHNTTQSYCNKLTALFKELFSVQLGTHYDGVYIGSIRRHYSTRQVRAHLKVYTKFHFIDSDIGWFADLQVPQCIQAWAINLEGYVPLADKLDNIQTRYIGYKPQCIGKELYVTLKDQAGVVVTQQKVYPLPVSKVFNKTNNENK